MKRKATPQEVRRLADAAFKKLSSNNPRWFEGSTIGKDTPQPKPVAAPSTSKKPDNQPLLVGAGNDFAKQPALKDQSDLKIEPVTMDKPKLELNEPKLPSTPMDINRVTKSVGDAVKFDAKPSPAGDRVLSQVANNEKQLQQNKMLEAKKAKLPQSSPKATKQPKKQAQNQQGQQGGKQRGKQSQPNQQQQRASQQSPFGPTPFGLLNAMRAHPQNDQIDIDPAFHVGADMSITSVEEQSDADEAFVETQVTVSEKQTMLSAMMAMRLRIVDAMLDRIESH